MYKVLAITLLALVLTIGFTQAYAVITKEDNTAKQQISRFLDGVTQGKYNNVSSIRVEKFNDTNIYILERQYIKPSTPTSPPPVCPPGTHLENGVCVPDVIIPIPTDKFTFSTVGDIDNNNGLVTQLNLVKKYNSQLFVVPGDFDYGAGSSVLSKITSAGLKPITIIADGNHDDCGDIQSYTGVSSCVYTKEYANGKVKFFVLDGNEPFTSSSATTQLNWIKSELQASTAMYNIVVIHEPFVTVSGTDHPSNGAFNSFDPVFQNKVDLVIQAHNHHYSITKVGTVWYGVFGMGTHDTGSAMYDCGNNNIKCITGTNGIELIELGLTTKSLTGKFISNSDTVVHTFGGN